MRAHCRRALAGLLLGAGLAGAVGGADAHDEFAAAAFRSRVPQDEVIYFLLPDRFENGDLANDRGGLSGDRHVTGFDPTDSGFYHGGDLKGALSRLDYIQGLGATAIWLGPIFKNKYVQGSAKQESAAYHGYWITDFLHVDPHFGTNADFARLVEAAHARGLKIYLDIVVNHTADVIGYRECPASACAYRARAEFPYTRRGGLTGEAINAGFLGDAAPNQTESNFSHLTRPDFAYTPFVPAGEEHVKVPDWLNDPIYYHNRGNTTFHGEDSLSGDFGGLDDLLTEHPRVLRGFIEIYGSWIDDYRIDGYRIDTAKHVNPEFWQGFVPAMKARAAAQGIPNFHLFAEVQSTGFDPAALARHTRSDGLPAILDFAFATAVREAIGGLHGTDRLAELFADDSLYEGGAAAAQQLATFISNHDDVGRIAYFVRQSQPSATEAEALQRVVLGYAMLLTLRGTPVIYYGDEQGFAGPGEDRNVREDMFASKTPSYLRERLLGTTATLATSSFVPQHPLYRQIAALAAMRREHAALRQGTQIVRTYSHAPGLFAVSRFDPLTNAEMLIVFNTATVAMEGQIDVAAPSRNFTAVRGECAAAASAITSYAVRVPALDYIVCAAEAPPR